MANETTETLQARILYGGPDEILSLYCLRACGVSVVGLVIRPNTARSSATNQGPPQYKTKERKNGTSSTFDRSNPTKNN